MSASQWEARYPRFWPECSLRACGSVPGSSGHAISVLAASAALMLSRNLRSRRRRTAPSLSAEDKQDKYRGRAAGQSIARRSGREQPAPCAVGAALRLELWGYHSRPCARPRMVSLSAAMHLADKAMARFGILALGREGTMKTTGVHHICIRVQDQVVSRRWYEDVLGFECVELQPSKDQIATWRGQPDSGTVVMMRAGDTYITLQPPLEGTAPDDRFSEYRIGVDHLAFAIKDRRVGHARQQPEGGGGTDGGVKTHPVLGKEYVVFRDPDNVSVGGLHAVNAQRGQAVLFDPRALGLERRWMALPADH